MASSNAIKAGEAYINMSLEDADLAEGLSDGRQTDDGLYR